jgi:DegV family protein with EDD domain
VPGTPTILVADSDPDRRQQLGLALYQGGYEVINAVDGEEALRFAAGLDPTLVIAHQGLQGLDPLPLRDRLHAAGRPPPPFLVLCGALPRSTDDLPETDVYHLESGRLDPPLFLHQVRLLLLAREIGGELNDTIDVLYGDLTRISIADLLSVLGAHRLSAHVELTAEHDVGLWLEDGEVIHARWGVAEGTKAFNRISALHRGSFVLKVEPVTVERTLELDLEALLARAADERARLDAAFRRLPPPSSRLELEMDDDFFAVDFTPEEQVLLTRVQSASSLAALLDLTPLDDLEVLSIVERLHQQGFLRIVEPERHIHVVTDSTCDLQPSLTRKLGVTVVPLSVLFGNRVYKDGIDLQPDEFYELLRTSEDFPSTSPPGRGEFLETYRQLAASGDILSVHISGKQSQTCEHACEAAAEGAAEYNQLRQEVAPGPEPVVRVVDSWSTSVGLGMLVLFASRMVHRGASVEEIGDRLESIRSRCHFLFLVDTLEFLRKGGRIGGARAWIGSLLGIKPILGMADGEVVPVDTVRGGRRALRKLISLFVARVEPSQPVFVTLAHAAAPRRASRLRDLLEGTFNAVEVVESEIGPVVGSHTGPGTVGAIVFQPTAEELELLRPG